MDYSTNIMGDSLSAMGQREELIGWRESMPNLLAFQSVPTRQIGVCMGVRLGRYGTS